ncbi:hypothetical protein AKO1_009074 [Acrasis kona]|uniref:Threonine/serine exporter-like N-terminal domain-containing protein n=1 Tax=Acrasis kona TaxID=1008807 RepID=A0AAW2ZHT3_9EUKA
MTGISPTIILPSQRSALMERKMSIKLGKGQRQWKHVIAKSFDINLTKDLSYEYDQTETHNDKNDPNQKSEQKRGFKAVQNLKNWWHTIKKHKKPRTAKVPYKDLTPEQQRDVRIFIIDFAYTMSIFAIPSHRLEHNLMVVSNYYGVMGNYFATPSGIWFNFGNILDTDDMESNNPNFSNFVRINGSALDMKKFMELDRLAYDVATGQIPSAQEARKKIKFILKETSTFSSPFWTVFVTTIFAAIFAVLLDGTWGEFISAFIGGFLVSMILLLQSRIRLLYRISTGLSALVCGFVAILFRFALYSTGVHINVTLVALSGVVMLLPGMSLTTSIDELTAGHLQSGTMRIVNVMVTVISIGFGLLITNRIDDGFKSLSVPYAYDQPFERQELPVWIKAAVLPPMIMIIIIYFKVPRFVTSYVFVTIACCAAFFGDMYWRLIMSSEIAGMLNAFIIGFIGNLYGFLSFRPSNVVTACAILLLVPGYASASSINLLLQRDVVTAVQTLFNAIIAATSLVTGLVVAEIVFPKKRGQFSY